MELFLGTFSQQIQSIKNSQLTRSVTTIWLRNINLISIDYGFRPRLRGRLTLRGLTLRRNPWIFGDEVFHFVYRYSCQHSHFWYLQNPSRVFLRRLTERSATACNVRKPLHTHRFGVWFKPRYILGAETLLDRWAVTLSLKDGCF